MPFTRRLASLRLTAMAALVVSAVLMADHLHPGRDFCPLAEACRLAHDSPLGTLFGIPTALLGMAAFGALFLLTLLPVEWARVLLRPAGLVGASAGVGFVAYQAFVLHSFCPLCVVVDAAGFLAGVLALTWPPLPIRLSGKRLGGEAASARLAWTLAALLAVVAPFALPRTESPAWVEITPLSEAALAGMEEVGPDPTPPAPPRPDVAVALASAEPSPPAGRADAPPPGDVLVSALPGDSLPPAAPAPAPPATPPAEVEPVRLVEYLNAYCAHCRATHARLERVIADGNVPVRRWRVYTWGSQGYPLWVRACAYAETRGLEQRLFEELLHARNQHPSEVYAAARRAGLDLTDLRRALDDPRPSPRLVRDRGIARSANLQGLPTLDIGHRRLMGEQSEAELREALEAALHEARRP